MTPKEIFLTIQHNIFKGYGDLYVIVAIDTEDDNIMMRSLPKVNGERIIKIEEVKIYYQESNMIWATHNFIVFGTGLLWMPTSQIDSAFTIAYIPYSKKFPHTCPSCLQPAYIGFSKIECSNYCYG